MVKVRQAWVSHACLRLFFPLFLSFSYSLPLSGSSNMPDLNSTALISFKDWTLRIRKSTHPTPRFLLLIHGHTGDENSMWVFARGLPAHYWIVAPRAPHPAESGGYSWRLPQTGNLDRLSLEMLRSTAESLIRLVDEYSASVGREADAGDFDVMGFSQG